MNTDLSILKSHLIQNQEDYENKTMEEKEKYGKDLILKYYKLIYTSWCYKSLLTPEQILEAETSAEEGWCLDLDLEEGDFLFSDDSGYESDYTNRN